MRKGEACGKPCNFWNALATGNGECRKNPPRIIDGVAFYEVRNKNSRVIDAVSTATQFPITNDDDWCGAYEPVGGWQGPC